MRPGDRIVDRSKTMTLALPRARAEVLKERIDAILNIEGQHNPDAETVREHEHLREVSRVIGSWLRSRKPDSNGDF